METNVIIYICCFFLSSSQDLLMWRGDKQLFVTRCRCGREKQRILFFFANTNYVQYSPVPLLKVDRDPHPWRVDSCACCGHAAFLFTWGHVGGCVSDASNHNLSVFTITRTDRKRLFAVSPHRGWWVLQVSEAFQDHGQIQDQNKRRIRSAGCQGASGNVWSPRSEEWQFSAASHDRLLTFCTYGNTWTFFFFLDLATSN